jgi:Lon protease-like protein
MDDDLDLRDFSGTARLFPLPGAVLFPHAVLPLHIFEPRYRQMTEDALADDRLVTIVALRESSAGQGVALGSPPVEAVGCLGRIIRHERLPDGRFNFLLLGRKRIRLKRELPGPKLYRTAEVEVLDDLYDDEPEEPRRSELIALFRRAFERQQKLDPDLASMLENALPLGVLSDIIAHALGLPGGLKQRFLAEPRVNARVTTLLTILRQIPAANFEAIGDDRPFPPPFSCN